MQGTHHTWRGSEKGSTNPRENPRRVHQSGECPRRRIAGPGGCPKGCSPILEGLRRGDLPTRIVSEGEGTPSHKKCIYIILQASKTHTRWTHVESGPKRSLRNAKGESLVGDLSGNHHLFSGEERQLGRQRARVDLVRGVDRFPSQVSGDELIRS